MNFSRLGARHKRAYMTWVNMKSRCDNPNSTDYKYYGGKGITYDTQWITFRGFLEDMGDPPDILGMKYSLDRKDSDKNYNKENCRWVDDFEQANNRSSPSRKSCISYSIRKGIIQI